MEIDVNFDPYADIEHPEDCCDDDDYDDDYDNDDDRYDDDYDSYDDNEDFSMPEFYQYFITDLSDDAVHWMRSTFPDLYFSFSELLNAWILCVSHYGTAWDYVPTEYVGHISISKEEYDRFNKE